MRNAQDTHSIPAKLSLQSSSFRVYYRIITSLPLCKGTFNDSAKIHKHQERDNKAQGI